MRFLTDEEKQFKMQLKSNYKEMLECYKLVLKYKNTEMLGNFLVKFFTVKFIARSNFYLEQTIRLEIRHQSLGPNFSYGLFYKLFFFLSCHIKNMRA